MTILPLLVGMQLAAAAAGLHLQTGAESPAMPTIINDTDGPLSLETTMPPDMDSLTPGDSTDWTVTTVLDDHPSGTLSIRVVSEGELAEHADGARLLLRQCSNPWAGRTCSAEAVTVVDAPLRSIDPATVHSVGSITAPRGPYFLVTLSLPENLPDTLQSTDLTLGLGFTASGDEEVIGSSDLPDSLLGGLAETGSHLIDSFLAAGLIALLAGVGVRLRSRTASGRSR